MKFWLKNRWKSSRVILSSRWGNLPSYPRCRSTCDNHILFKSPLASRRKICSRGKTWWMFLYEIKYPKSMSKRIPATWITVDEAYNFHEQNLKQRLTCYVWALDIQIYFYHENWQKPIKLGFLPHCVCWPESTVHNVHLRGAKETIENSQ